MNIIAEEGDVISPIHEYNPSTHRKINKSVYALARKFQGLPEGVTKFDVLRVAKQAKVISNQEAIYLEYMIKLTSDQDWQCGGHPRIYAGVMTIAHDLDKVERVINTMERSLHEKGLLIWNDSSNGKRFKLYEKRTGRVIDIYGPDLSPLGQRYNELVSIAEDIKIKREQWKHAKAELSRYRRQLCAYYERAMSIVSCKELAGQLFSEYEKINDRITNSTRLEEIEAMIKQTCSIVVKLDALADTSETVKEHVINSDQSAEKCRHNYNTNNTKIFLKKDSNKQDDTCVSNLIQFQSGKARTESNSLRNEKENIKIPSKSQLLSVASEGFKALLPEGAKWCDLVQAAHDSCSMLGVSQSAWIDACEIIGRNGAAACIIIFDRKKWDQKESIGNVGGYLRGCINKAENGRLNLMGSVFGLLSHKEMTMQ